MEYMGEAVFARLDREIWLLTAADNERRGGLIITFVSQASIVPECPRVIIGIAKQHHTWGLIEASGAFALHLLSERHLDWIWRFGLRSGREYDKWTGMNSTTCSTGSPILADALGWLDCRVEARFDTGDRTLYLGEVVQAELSDALTSPLTFQRFMSLIPADKRQELQAQLVHDRAVDGAAIRSWRQHQASSSCPRIP